MPSYSPVYSVPFISSVMGSTPPAFEVPAGFTAVIRQWSVYQDIGSWIAQLLASDSSIAGDYVLDTQAQTGLTTQTQGRGHWAIPENATIHVYLTELGTQPSVFVGGYLLRNTAP